MIRKFNRPLTYTLIGLVLMLVTVGPSVAQSADPRVETSDQLQDLLRIQEQEDDFEDLRDTAIRQPLRDEEGYGPLGRQRILRRKKQHRYYSIAASMSYQTSDNIFLTSDPRVTVPFPQPERESGSSGVGSISGSYHYNLPSPYRARSGISFRSTNYQDAESLNYDFFSFRNTLSRRIKTPGLRTSVGLGYRFQSLLYGADSRNNNRLDSIYDQHVLSAYGRSLYPFTRYQFVTGSVRIENETTNSLNNARTGSEADPEKIRFSATSSYRYRYSQKVNYQMRYQLRRDWYRHQTRPTFISPSQDKRKDFTHLLSSGLSYELTPELKLGLNVSYTENHSSFDRSDYNEFSASFQVSNRTRF